MNPTLLKGEELNLFTGLKTEGTKLKEKILLALFSWYAPKEIGVLLNLRLCEIWGEERRDLKETLLDSKLFALGALLVQDKWNENDFFGNILTEEEFEGLFQRVFRSCRLKRIRKRARPTVRRRGHRDGGRKEKCRSFDQSRRPEKLLEPLELILQEEVQEEQRILQFKLKIKLRLELEFIA
jgi:hypothetical protein